jgi:MSHA biogenesis protein MshK
MDATVSAARSLCQLRCCLGLGMAALLCSANGAAQALIDPTRPPAMLRSAGAGTIELTIEPGVPQLQSVLIARHPGGRHVAIIDGRTVRLGERFKGATVDTMTQTEVVLVKGKERQVLKLFPAKR